eukprot:gene4846-6877_t
MSRDVSRTVDLHKPLIFTGTDGNLYLNEALPAEVEEMGQFIIHDHIKDTICNSNVETFQYLLNCLSCIYERVKVNFAGYFYTAKGGTGKSTLTTVIMKLLLEDRVYITSDHNEYQRSEETLTQTAKLPTLEVGVVPASSSSKSGCSERSGKEIIKVVIVASSSSTDALRVGYRYFDCAQFYGNEALVGEALSESNIPRQELFLVSKVWNDTIYKGEDAVKEQVDQSLIDLKTSYLDLCLVHWPVPGKHIEAYKALEDLQRQEKIRGIGISNYTIEDYEALKPNIEIKPLVNQIEVNPYLFRKKTIEYFFANGILIEAYRALRNGQGMDNDTISAIAAKHECTPAQVLVRWCLQNNIIVIAKSSKPERMMDNLKSTEIRLDDDDMHILDKMTTKAAFEEFYCLYKKCIVRDTPLSMQNTFLDINDITVD